MEEFRKKTFEKNLMPMARSLRNNLTPAELRLWLHIKENQILGVQFFAQSIVGHCIVDFYAPKIKLVIEIDGAHHFEFPQNSRDDRRDNYLTSLGLKVLRFHNGQVINELFGVLEEIYSVVESRITW